MNVICGQFGLGIPYDEFQKLFGARANCVLKKYKLSYISQMGASKTCTLYKIVNMQIGDSTRKYLVLPRMSAVDFIKGKLVARLTGRFAHISCANPLKPDARLYPYQHVVVNHFMTNVFNESRADRGLASGVLNLQAGAGKTFVAAGLIAALGVKTLYITILNHLAKQARDDFKSMLTNPESVDIMIINSALKLPMEQFRNYSFIIFDEIHTMCSEKRQQIFWRAQAKYCLGMSATTANREDMFDEIYYKHLGRPVLATSIPGFDYRSADFKLHIKFIKYHGSSKYTKNLKHESTGKVFVHYMYKQFMSDPVRMKLICDEINKLYAIPSRCIYVFAEEREHLQEIIRVYKESRIAMQAQMPDMELLDDKHVGYFVGGLPVEDITKIKLNARIVFTTYNLSMTGTSWTKMNAMVLATSRKKGMEQLVGRIMRQGSDQNIPRVVVDIVDMRTCLCKQMKKRKREYKLRSPTIEKITYSGRADKAGRVDLQPVFTGDYIVV